MPLLAMLGGGTAARMGGFGTRPADPRDTFYGQTLINISSGLAVPTSNNNVFLDSSSLNTTITKGGNTAVTTFSPYRENWSFQVRNSAWVSFAGPSLSNTSTTFTVEAWVHPQGTQTTDPSSGNAPALVGDFNSSSNLFNWGIGLTNGNALRFTWYDGAYKTVASPAAALTSNTWSHIAVVADAGNINLYVNGTAQTRTGTNTVTTRILSTSNTTIGQYRSGLASYQGYVSSISILDGVAKYTSNFTPSKTPITRNATGQTFLFPATGRLADFNTTTTAKTLVANSSGTGIYLLTYSPVLSRPYDRTIDGASAFFDGTTDHLALPYNINRNIGSGDFCLECWVYPTSVASTGVIVSTRSGTAAYGPILLWRSTSTLQLYMSGNGTTWNIVGPLAHTTPLVTHRWQHVAAYRVGGVIYLSLDGVIVTGATSNATPIVNSENWRIGIDGGETSNPWIGHISNMRLQVGSHDYTSNSCPVPTTLLSNTANTKMLLNFNNAGVIDSTGNFSIETAAGTAFKDGGVSKFGGSVIRFGGAMNLTPVANTSLGMGFPAVTGGGNFAIEFWLYKTSNGQSGIYDQRINTGVSEDVIHIYNKGDGTIGVYIALSDRLVTGQVSLNTWNHIALARISGSLYLYLNGVSVGSSYVWAGTGQNRILVGAAADGFQLSNGYLSDFRITVNTARGANTSVYPVPTGFSPAY